MTHPQEKTIDLIRKLLALAESPNEHEAAAAAAKAQELMVKHKLQAIDLREAAEEYGVFRYHIVSQGRWKRRLLQAIVQSNFCDLVRFPGLSRYAKGYSFGIIGKESDIEVTIYLFEYLSGVVERLGKEKSGLGLKWVTSYREGLVLGINRKLKLEWNKTIESSPDTKALILVEDAALQSAKVLMFPDLVQGAGLPTKHIQRSALDAGYRDGQNVAINRGVQGGAGRVQGLLK